MGDKNISEEKPAVLHGQPCPICNKNTLSLTELTRDVPFFGKVYLFSMSCTSCKYHKGDVEADEKHDPTRYTFEVTSKADLDVRIVKSSEATVKIPHVANIEPGPASDGFVSNVEGLINRVKKQVETLRDSAEEKSDRKKAKNLIKKIDNVLMGSEHLKIIIEDPSGNSAIISDKAEKVKIKGKKEE
ncbi:ZPR1 zinc finger domain-containing protein [Candidatus Woesearchaeota archaeon]|nr:ZPR1 zinc finger domain-containing protein [Candidatus Woesearchaeota archaeon]